MFINSKTVYSKNDTIIVRKKTKGNLPFFRLFLKRLTTLSQYVDLKIELYSSDLGIILL